MKILPWICGLSLAANAALLAAFAFRVPHDASRLASAPAESARVPHAAAVSRDTASTEAVYQAADTPLARLLAEGDLRAMRDALAAAGLSETDAKAIIRRRIQENQKAARAAIDQRSSPADTTWWYDDNEARSQFDQERRVARTALNDELAQTLAALFGPEPETPAAAQVHTRARFLPEDKRAAVSAVLRDYEAMEKEARPRGYNGATLPSDEEKIRYITDERRKDLAALLTAEEMREYDLRYSSTAQQLRWRIGGMQPTFDEYRAIYDMQADLDRNFDQVPSGDRPDDFWKKREQAETAGMAELRAKLGDERYIDYALSNDHDARTVKEAARRYDLPAETARDLWQLRQDAGREGMAIYEDKTLDREQKRARIAEIGRRARDTIAARLGPEAMGELKNNDFVTWVQNYEKHQVTVYNELGNSSTGHGL
jgi:hypothetical protein